MNSYIRYRHTLGFLKTLHKLCNSAQSNLYIFCTSGRLQKISLFQIGNQFRTSAICLSKSGSDDSAFHKRQVMFFFVCYLQINLPHKITQKKISLSDMAGDFFVCFPPLYLSSSHRFGGDIPGPIPKRIDQKILPPCVLKGQLPPPAIMKPKMLWTSRACRP